MKEDNFSDLYKTHILGIFDNDSKLEMKIGGRHGKGIRCIKVRQYVYEDLKKQCQKKVLVGQEPMNLHSYLEIPIKVDDSIKEDFKIEYYE